MHAYAALFKINARFFYNYYRVRKTEKEKAKLKLAIRFPLVSSSLDVIVAVILTEIIMNRGGKEKRMFSYHLEINR